MVSIIISVIVGEEWITSNKNIEVRNVQNTRKWYTPPHTRGSAYSACVDLYASEKTKTIGLGICIGKVGETDEA